MRGWLAGWVLAAALAPAPVMALSCLEYSIRDAYWQHEGRAETFLLVRGSFSDLREAEPEAFDPPENFANEYAVWTARFQGFKASRRAFDKPFEAEVQLIFPDFSMIGGGMDTSVAADWLPGEMGLVWLEQTADGYRLTAELCAPLIDTDPASMKPALDCLAGRWCPKSG